MQIDASQVKKITAGGKTYELHPLSFEDIQQLQPWIDSNFPDPFVVVNEAIAKGNYSVAQQRFLMEQAFEKAAGGKCLIGSPEAEALMGTLEGIKQLMVLAIRKGRPDFSDEEAKELFRNVGIADLHSMAPGPELTTIPVGPIPLEELTAIGKRAQNGKPVRSGRRK